jgi:hypothetical protein
MTTTTIPAGGLHDEYLEDRYDRMRNASEMIASDPNVAGSDSIFGGDGLRAFIQSLVDARLLDGLSRARLQHRGHACDPGLPQRPGADGVADYRVPKGAHSQPRG